MSATPPLLMLAQGRKPRPRKAPDSRPKEITLHIAVAKLLRDQEEFCFWCVRHVLPYVVAYSTDDALVAFEVWGCLREIGGAR